MAKLDRLGWAAGIAFVSHGATFGVRVSDLAVLPQLLAHLPPGWKPASSPVVEELYSLIVGGDSPNSHIRRYTVLYLGAARLARTTDLAEVLEGLEAFLHTRVAVGSRRGLFVHAGVVGWRGRAIVIPGRSRTGKTFLVKALVQAGATYLSDEYAVFDSRGRVHPYPKRLSLRAEGPERPRLCSIESLGGRAGTCSLPVGLVAITEYHPGAHYRPRVLSGGEAVLALLDNTLLARSRPELALAALQRVAVGAVTLKGKRGEAEETTAALLERLERAGG